MKSAARMFLVVLTAVALQGAAFSRVSLYGVTIGEALDLPACGGAITGMCQSPNLGTVAALLPGHLRGALVSFPSGGRPDIAKYAFFNVGSIDGKVVEITVPINGQAAQKAALLQLTAKFGKPVAAGIDQFRNAFNAEYDSIEAVWRVGDNFVALAGIVGKPDTGAIIARSPAAQEYHARERAAETAKQPAL